MSQVTRARNCLEWACNSLMTKKEMSTTTTSIVTCAAVASSFVRKRQAHQLTQTIREFAAVDALGFIHVQQLCLCVSTKIWGLECNPRGLIQD